MRVLCIDRYLLDVERQVGVSEIEGTINVPASDEVDIIPMSEHTGGLVDIRVALLRGDFPCAQSWKKREVSGGVLCLRVKRVHTVSRGEGDMRSESGGVAIFVSENGPKVAFAIEGPPNLRDSAVVHRGVGLVDGEPIAAVLREIKIHPDIRLFILEEKVRTGKEENVEERNAENKKSREKKNGKNLRWKGSSGRPNKRRRNRAVRVLRVAMRSLPHDPTLQDQSIAQILS